MRPKVLETRCGKSLWICRWSGYLALILMIGCSPSKPDQEVTPVDLDLTRDGQHTSGDWTYDYSITNPGTRSEGYHGTLSHNQIEVPDPIHINDYYETPWGRLYWLGQPPVLFGAHGWMPKPLVREPVRQALIDPAIVHSERFMVHVKILAPEELATPDRLEQDSAVLKALEPFGVTQVHVQRNWFPVGADPITLHDTKRWGMFTVCRADLNQRAAPTLEFSCTGDFTVDTLPKPVVLSELMAAPEFPARPSSLSLSPQIDTLQPIKCTLKSFVGEPLILYVMCRIEDQGPRGPWKSPARRVYESN